MTGGTVTSNGVCTNSVAWSGLNAAPPTPTATPQPTSPPGPSLNTYYVTTFLDSANTTDFCTTNYLTTTTIKSEATQISQLLNTMIYDENDDPFVGSSGTYAYVSTTFNSSSSGSADPRYLIEISGLAQCDDLAQLNCSGGGNPL